MGDRLQLSLSPKQLLLLIPRQRSTRVRHQPTRHSSLKLRAYHIFSLILLNQSRHQHIVTPFEVIADDGVNYDRLVGW